MKKKIIIFRQKNMPTTNAGNFIPLAEAITMTSTFRKQKELILNPIYQGKNILPICETFDRTLFDSILLQPGCAGIRLYFAMDNLLKIHAVMVGVNENNEDMLPSNEMDNTIQIIEEGTRCPDNCPPSSSLNS